ncbi:hypothetical protein DL89DRAFT_263677 [Linderina pennispora]|uniref:DNA topoisomerase I n=1 Tax=Linderina pennispora TaxID=61395 RepID=A0A1Y1WKA6_9FUNG|nr:uncharacterized protein DL89DRAFT_263677 [Linderina pennispora]ORX73646.1 hypothetical protein DL89DRAFT_263677 [Linderina pennispora]
MSSSDSDDGVPLSARVSTDINNGKPNDDDVPLSRRRPAVSSGASDSSDSESDQPLSKKVKVETPVKKAVAKRAAAAMPKSNTKPKPKPEPKANGKTRSRVLKRRRPEVSKPKQPAKSVANRKPLIKAESSMVESSADGSVASEGEGEGDYKWWLDEKDGSSEKWHTLEHNGVMFPPDYVPHGVPLIYRKKEIRLVSEAEEVATFFAAVVDGDHGNNPVQPSARPCPRKKRSGSKLEKQAIEEKFKFCLMDGRREKVGNFRIEPPDLFRGRGAHPKTGMLKKRVLPEQVTINIGKDAKVPDPPAGHRWGSVTHDNTVTWLAMWKENVNGNIKYVFLAAGSSLKGQSDMRKFEKARNLKGCVADIRRQYTKDLRSETMAARQRATAMYLIDRYALRAGNEKGDDEADTVGCCSLRVEHVQLFPPRTVHFDFLGKDSIRYQRTTEVDQQVWKNLKIFQKKPKTPEDMLFDRLNTSALNKHLQKLMPGLTAKVFRTYNASFLAYNRANREVAVLCNHQRSVSKGFETQMAKRQLLKDHLLWVAPDLKKKHPELAEKEPGVTKSWIKSHWLATCELDREKARKKFERDNEKLKGAGEPELPQSKLDEQLAAIDEREKSINRWHLTARINNIEIDKIEKDENKTTALSTSKINYIDPRISVAWCKKYGVSQDKIFNKALREKFNWAMEVDGDWTF